MATTEPAPIATATSSTPSPWRCLTNEQYEATKKKVKDNMGAITVGTIEEKPVIWSIGHSGELSWYNASTYATSDQIKAACDSWDDVCGVEFREVKRNKAFIIIRDATPQEERDNQGVIASAFFPGDSPREVTIYRVFQRTENRISVLIHEFGHVLGFRHEHIWKKLTSEPIKYKDENGVEHGALLLTNEDPLSIMHYQKLWDDEQAKVPSKLSLLDKIGAQMLYGQDFNAVIHL